MRTRGDWVRVVTVPRFQALPRISLRAIRLNYRPSQFSPGDTRKTNSVGPARTARPSSRLLYPKTAAQKLHQSSPIPKNQNPQNGQHGARFDWGFGAVCFGVSPVAAVFGSAPGSATSPKHRIQHKPTHHAGHSKQDISTWLGIGHFYLALTMSRFRPCVAAGRRPAISLRLQTATSNAKRGGRRYSP